MLADAYFSHQQVPDALQTLKRAVAIYPREERHYVDLANLCMQQEAHDLGLEILDADIRPIPRSARLHGMRGVLLAQVSQFEEAEAEFARDRPGPHSSSRTIWPQHCAPAVRPARGGDPFLGEAGQRRPR